MASDGTDKLSSYIRGIGSVIDLAPTAPRLPPIASNLASKSAMELYAGCFREIATGWEHSMAHADQRLIDSVAAGTRTVGNVEGMARSVTENLRRFQAAAEQAAKHYESLAQNAVRSLRASSAAAERLLNNYAALARRAQQQVLGKCSDGMSTGVGTDISGEGNDGAHQDSSSGQRVGDEE